MARLDVLDWIRKNKSTSSLIALALIWLLARHSVSPLICGPSPVCWLYPDSWPVLFGITAQSSPWIIGLVAAVLFALPFGRSGLLATLVGIHLAEPVFGVFGVFGLFVAASMVSIVLVQAAVEYGLHHPKSAIIHLRLAPINTLFGPSIRKNALLWISIGNLVGSQWQMGALGVVAGVRRQTIWLGLLLGNLVGFVLVYVFSQVPNLDAISVVLLVLVTALVFSSPALWANLKTTFSSAKSKTAATRSQRRNPAKPMSKTRTRIRQRR
ncbi:hypothetical protein HY994_00125 [Candidatus Micrarchaeota archaeon]|nr:hypothetical protein [Candidatus Micrarchaeota archaeon]